MRHLRGLPGFNINRGLAGSSRDFPDCWFTGWYFQNIEIPDDLFAKNHLFSISGV